MFILRAITGQIASNTSQPIGGVANALTALSVLPKPELSYLQHWLFDTPDINPINDNDGIVDAGETVELAIMLRNYWGKASNVTASLEACRGAVFRPLRDHAGGYHRLRRDRLLQLEG